MNEHQIIEQLHSQSTPYALVVTGGGSGLIGLLLSVPGGSRSLLEGIVPYHSDALSHYLGHEPEKWCSLQTSIDMAERAYTRASGLAGGQEVVGIGCTASLVSDRPKRGEHRFHLSIYSSDQCQSWSLTLDKGKRDRPGEEQLVQRVALNAMAEKFGIKDRLELPLTEKETIETETLHFDDSLTRLYSQKCPTVCCEIDGRITEEALRPKLLIPGSFNPLHHGHTQMASVASRLTGETAAFELSIQNVDKGVIPKAEARRRLRQFAWRHPVWLTKKSTFIAKAEIFPQTTFVLGVDTAQRLVMPRYYQDDESIMIQTLKRIRELGCRFLVAGRADDEGRFLTLSDVSIPNEVKDCFDEIPEAEMRVDISSTELRSED